MVLISAIIITHLSVTNQGCDNGCIILLVLVPFKEILQSKIEFCVSDYFHPIWGVKIISLILYVNKSASSHSNGKWS